MDSFLALQAADRHHDEQQHASASSSTTGTATTPNVLLSPTSSMKDTNPVDADLPSVAEIIPDPAEAGDITAWEQLKSSAADVDVASEKVETDSLLARAEDKLHQVMDTIDHFAAVHQQQQKQNPLPSQHTNIVADVNKAKQNEELLLQHQRDEQRKLLIEPEKDLDRIFETPVI